MVPGAPPERDLPDLLYRIQKSEAGSRWLDSSLTTHYAIEKHLVAVVL